MADGSRRPAVTAGQSAGPEALDYIRTKARQRRRGVAKRLGKPDLDQLELVPADPLTGASDEGQALPWHPPSLKRAILAALGRPVAGRLLVETEVMSRGRGMATGALVRRKLIDPVSGELVVSLFEKVLCAPTDAKATSISWYREALVYADGLFDAEDIGIRVPECFEIYLADDRRIRLYLQDLCDCQHPMEESHRFLVARSLGCFGGWAARNELYGSSWLEGTGKRINPPRKTGYLTGGIRSFVASEAAIPPIREAFEQLMANLDAVMVLRNSCRPTVSHMDAHVFNVLFEPVEQDVFLIDWARVSKGYLGEDLTKLVSPFRLILLEGLRYDEYHAYESAMMENYLAGLATAEGEGDALKVKVAYDLRVAFNCLMRLAAPSGLLNKVAKFPEQVAEQRLLALQEFMLDLSSRVQQLVAMARSARA